VPELRLQVAFEVKWVNKLLQVLFLPKRIVAAFQLYSLNPVMPIMKQILI